MFSKRGRKQDNNLPPNRARDVQRAFRARRAAHFRALEERVAELEEENRHLRQALGLPPSVRPPLGRGPIGKDQPHLCHVEKSQQQSISPRGESSAGSPTSHTSSPELGLIAPSISSRTASGTANYSDRIPSLLHSPTSGIYHQDTPPSYSPTSERSIDNRFEAARKRRAMRRYTRDDVQHDFYSVSQNYQTSESNLHPETLRTDSYHSLGSRHHEWNSLPSVRIYHPLQDQEFPQNHQFPPSPVHAHSSHVTSSYHPTDIKITTSPLTSSQHYTDGRLHRFIG